MYLQIVICFLMIRNNAKEIKQMQKWNEISKVILFMQSFEEKEPTLV